MNTTPSTIVRKMAEGVTLATMKVVAAEPRSELESAMIEAICEDCPFNLDLKWICQNPAIQCAPCLQKRAGGLQFYIRQKGSRCPMKKWGK